MIKFRTSHARVVVESGIRVFDDLTAISIVHVDENGDELILANVANPLDFPTKDFEISKYTVGLFTHDNWPEARILNVLASEQRVGLIFSLQSLASTESVLPSSTAWNECGFIALQKLCLGEYLYGPKELTAQADGSVVPITDLFGEDVIVIVLDEEACTQAMSRSDYVELLDRSLPSLAKYGFYRLNESRGVDGFCAKALTLDSSKNNLTLKCFSADFPQSAINFFREIVLTSAQREQHPAFRLFIGYQMIEILIADIYSKVIRDFARRAIGAGDIVTLRSLTEWLEDKTKEKTRIGLVFNGNRNRLTEDGFNNLKRDCDLLLVKFNETTSKNVESALYAIRNHVFHAFSRVASYTSDVEDIATSLFIVICDLAISYKAPSSTP